MLIGILLFLSGVALLAGYILIPDFLFGASLGGVAGLLAPFGLILLGVLLIFASTVDRRNKTRSQEREETPPPPPPPLPSS
jgi:hypothetical protein